MEKIQELRQNQKLSTLIIPELESTIRAKGFNLANGMRKDLLVQELEKILNAENDPNGPQSRRPAYPLNF
jgi:hypothetical protein